MHPDLSHHVSSDRVDEVVEHRPACCRGCGHSLADASAVGSVGCHQQIELPPIRARVTEHRLLTLAYPGCGVHNRGALPPEIGTKQFGPRLSALAALLLSRFRLSRRDLVAFFGDVLDVPASALGTTQRFATEVRAPTARCAAPYAEARAPGWTRPLVARAHPAVSIDQHTLRGR